MYACVVRSNRGAHRVPLLAQHDEAICKLWLTACNVVGPTCTRHHALKVVHLDKCRDERRPEDPRRLGGQRSSDDCPAPWSRSTGRAVSMASARCFVKEQSEFAEQTRVIDPIGTPVPRRLARRCNEPMLLA